MVIDQLELLSLSLSLPPPPFLSLSFFLSLFFSCFPPPPSPPPLITLHTCSDKALVFFTPGVAFGGNANVINSAKEARNATISVIRVIDDLTSALGNIAVRNVIIWNVCTCCNRVVTHAQNTVLMRKMLCTCICLI